MKPVPMTSAERYRVVLCRRFPQMEASFASIGLSL
jgi:hypothetical protein